ncbi:MAG: hypothetical protein ACE5E7_06890 [Anaerolineae bacterium]
MFSDTTLIVGVDVHGRTNVTLAMDGQGDVLDKHQRFPNHGTGTEQLARYLAQLAQGGGFDTIHLAAEATNNFWLPFFCQLGQSPQLSPWTLTLYPFNPRLVRNFKKALAKMRKQTCGMPVSSLNVYALAKNCLVPFLWKNYTCRCVP